MIKLLSIAKSTNNWSINYALCLLRTSNKCSIIFASEYRITIAAA